jgi:SAM-dependent methyltransferase
VDDRKAMDELYRTLKPGGWAVLQVPISLALEKTYEDFSITTERGRLEAFGQWDHVRLYARDYKERLERAGFKVDIFRWTTEIEKFGTRENKFGLNEKEGVYRAKKPG